MKHRIKLLSDEDREVFKEKEFILQDNYILVKNKSIHRTTIHPIDESFELVLKNRRKLTITPTTIELWRKNFQNENLIDVQQAVNVLSLMLVDINEENVRKILTKIKN